MARFLAYAVVFAFILYALYVAVATVTYGLTSAGNF